MNGVRASAAYTASKHAVVGFTKNTRFMYAKEGISCNAIAPDGGGDEHRSIDDQHKSVWCSQTAAWIGGHYPRITTDSAWTAY
ncbi:3-ketoacyl-(acyl-carrier-protein) reductase [compost metagenome]